jgi:polyhydroxyalkanoate synthesis regulator phasin
MVLSFSSAMNASLIAIKKENYMKHSQKIITAAAIMGIIGTAGVATTAIAATGDSNANNYPPIVQKIASTFGLDPAKVNAVFKQQHQENWQNREAKLKSTFDQAVKDGKLTQDQANKLMAELKSLHNQNKSDRRHHRQGLKTQLEQWADANGITNLSQILPGSNRR